MICAGTKDMERKGDSELRAPVGSPCLKFIITAPCTLWLCQGNTQNVTSLIPTHRATVGT